ncbi:Malectin-like domain [Dillenia turbinata]|uniref:Malectin-like domain n=1 Tax=Dillenia turbinata TaxID=194707 RepID=A0AAN8UQ05_9MAGN
MSPFSLSLILALIVSLLSLSFSQPPHGNFLSSLSLSLSLSLTIFFSCFLFSATLINCGATVDTEIDGYLWSPDTEFTSTGTPKTLTTPNVLPLLSTVRSFPISNRKSCYTVPVYRYGKYLIRTTYFYGGINGQHSPPVFDQIVDGTIWSMVNTTEDYSKGNYSYYEGVFVAQGKYMSICVASNSYTDSNPFMSALELVLMTDSVYNSTDFGKHGLGLIARHSFGYQGNVIRYPDDQFDRFWEPFGQNDPTGIISNVSVSGFWNLPPLKVFETQLTTGPSEHLELQWPVGSIPNSTYYIALYFADDHANGSRVFNISVSGIPYYSNLNVTSDGVVVFATQWPLSALTNITLTPAAGSTVGPLINAGEVFSVLPLGGRTTTRDVLALGDISDEPAILSGEGCRIRGKRNLEYFKDFRLQLKTFNLDTSTSCLKIKWQEKKDAFYEINYHACILCIKGLHFIALEKVRNSLQHAPPDWNGDPCLPSQYSWTGITCSTGSRIRVISLNLTGMDLSGTLSPSIANLTALSTILLGNNNISGSIPDLSSLKMLEIL